MDAEAKTECSLIGGRRKGVPAIEGSPAPCAHTDTVPVVSPSQQHIWLLFLQCGLSKAGREEAWETQVIKKEEVDLL